MSTSKLATDLRWSYYTSPPGPPPGYPSAEREPPPGPPPGYPPADRAPEPVGIPLGVIGHFDSAHAGNVPVHGHEQAKAMSAYAAANDDDGAAEHVLLTLDDLPELRQRGQGLLGVLHNEARAFTDKFANADHEAIGVQANLAAEWPNWRLYVANHTLAPDLIGPGVKAFTAEFIDGTRDPNRGGRPRLDLVIRHANGAYCRLHPGSTRKTDAKPRFFPASAPEPAAYEWRRPDAAGIFSSDRAKLVPQIDKLGKSDIWQAVQRIPRELIPDIQSGAWLDITCGRHLLWWLWICNLGNHTRTVIGAGVHIAHVAMNTDHEAVFKFTRIDGTDCVVRLVCMHQGHGRQLRVYV